MSESRIAKRYATPLLKLADEQKSVDIVKSDMEQFLAVCKGNMAFLNMLKSPVIPHLKKGEILVKIFEGKVFPSEQGLIFTTTHSKDYQ